MAESNMELRNQACAKDAFDPDSCICGNCANGAVTQACLRYTKVSTDWRLAECRAGLDCESLFPPSTGRRKGDVVVACPCNNDAAPFAPPAQDATSTPSPASDARKLCAPSPHCMSGDLGRQLAQIALWGSGFCILIGSCAWILWSLWNDEKKDILPSQYFGDTSEQIDSSRGDFTHSLADSKAWRETPEPMGTASKAF